jgi:hypothetical protein
VLDKKLPGDQDWRGQKFVELSDDGETSFFEVAVRTIGLFDGVAQQ